MIKIKEMMYKNKIIINNNIKLKNKIKIIKILIKTKINYQKRKSLQPENKPNKLL